jgi:hypothetical protein
LRSEVTGDQAAKVLRAARDEDDFAFDGMVRHEDLLSVREIQVYSGSAGE